MSETKYEVIASHRWMSLCKGFQGEPIIVAGSGTFIVPIDSDGNVLFIIEPRRVDGKPTLALPGGGIEDGEEMAVSANRELQEELGYKANRMDSLGMLNPMYRIAELYVHVFLARNLVESKLQGDENYDIRIEKVPLAEFETLIASGRLKDSTIISALFMARSFIAREGESSK